MGQFGSALEIKALGGPEPSVVVRGEIDLSNYADALQLVCNLAPGDKEWLLDLRGVSYMDSTGVRILLALKDQYHTRFRMIASNPIMRILDTLGLTSEFRWQTGELSHTPHFRRES
jgi:anti-anti-sigma factor